MRMRRELQRRALRDHGDADVGADSQTAGAADGGDDSVDCAEQGATHCVDGGSWGGAELGAWLCGDGGAGACAVCGAAGGGLADASQPAISEPGDGGLVIARSDAVAGASAGIVSSADTCG